MARPVDPTRRAAVLAKAADYVLEQGLAGLSLRPASEGTRHQPADAALRLRVGGADRRGAGPIRRREASLLEAEVRTLEDVWAWIAAPERESFLRLFFEIYLGGLATGAAEPLVRDWLDFLRERWHPPVDEATATLMVAVVRGLLLDRLATGDRRRTDGAASVLGEALVVRLVPRLELLAQVAEELTRVGAVDEAVIVGECQVHQRTDRDRVVAGVVRITQGRLTTA